MQFPHGYGFLLYYQVNIAVMGNHRKHATNIATNTVTTIILLIEVLQEMSEHIIGIRWNSYDGSACNVVHCLLVSGALDSRELDGHAMVKATVHILSNNGLTLVSGVLDSRELDGHALVRATVQIWSNNGLTLVSGVFHIEDSTSVMSVLIWSVDCVVFIVLFSGALYSVDSVGLMDSLYLAMLIVLCLSPCFQVRCIAWILLD